jgi:predicted HTH domain antitoxin
MMTQINFRVSDEEKQIISALAEQKGLSVAELARSALLKEIQPVRIDIAFNLLSQGKIGRKQAWTISGLNYREFLVEWSKRGIQENIPEETWDKGLELSKTFDPKPILKKILHPNEGI